ncbi:hypothetical protein [Blastococcus sp. SYSU DS0533]
MTAATPAIDILYIDDQSLLLSPDRLFAPHRLLPLDSTASLAEFLDGRIDPKLPQAAGLDPRLALVDLDLGADRPGGITALRLLADSPLADIPVAVVSADTHHHRDLYPVLAAEALGRPLLLATKDSDSLAALAAFASRIAANPPRVLRDDVPHPGLKLIEPVTVTGPSSTSRPRTLTQALFGLPWLPPLWQQLAEGAAWDKACRRATTTPEKARQRLGPLVAAIELRGGSISDLGGRLDLAAAEHEWDTGAFRQQILRFSSRYQRVLADPHIHEVAGYVLARRS